VIVVCDASPVIALAAVEHLELLHALYGEVVLPRAVRDEIAAGPRGEATLLGAPWLVEREAVDRMVVAELETEVDRGEAEAIA
jgi:predicted nucleic acid-binding protein